MAEKPSEAILGVEKSPPWSKTGIRRSSHYDLYSLVSFHSVWDYSCVSGVSDTELETKGHTLHLITS